MKPRATTVTTTGLSFLAAACTGAAAFLHGHAAVPVAVPAAILAAGISVVLAVPLAVVLARLHFEGRAMVYSVLVFASATSPALLDHAATMPPDLYTRVGFGVPLATWVVYLAARALPPHIEEAAVLDGASALAVLAPLLRPAVLAATALVFLYCAFDLSAR